MGRLTPGNTCERYRPNVTVLEMFYRRAICPLECRCVPEIHPAKQSRAVVTKPDRRNLPQHDISADLKFPVISFLFSIAELCQLPPRFPVNYLGDVPSPSF
jgi:hypothetical protein